MDRAALGAVLGLGRFLDLYDLDDADSDLLQVGVDRASVHHERLRADLAARVGQVIVRALGGKGQ